MRPEPFRIDVEEIVLDDLQRRLRRTRWASVSRDDGWHFGVSRAYLEELAAYWLTGFDWRSHEALLNRLPQFTARVDGGRIHFIHQRGDGDS